MLLLVCVRAMRRLNRNRVKTNQIGQYTHLNYFIIINLSASRRNRSRENRDASQNLLFFPPLVTAVQEHSLSNPTSFNPQISNGRG